MANVIQWQLKVGQIGANQAAAAIDKIADSAGDAVADVTKLGDATEQAAEAAMKAAGAYKDAAGRLRDVNGRFIKGGVEGLMAAQAAASRLAEKVQEVQQVGPVIAEGDIPKPALVRNLVAEFDKLQNSLGAANANAVLWAQSVKRGEDHLKALRAAARASAAPTDAERMMMAAKPSDLIAIEGAMKRRAALMERLRDAARGSWGATDAEKMIGRSLPAQLRPVQQLSLAQRALRRLLTDISATTGGRGLAALNSVVNGFERAAPVLERARGAAAAAAPAFRALGGAAIFAAKGGAALAAGGVIGGTLFAGAVVKAQAYRESVTKGLEIQLKSASAASEALILASRTADYIGAARAEMAGQFNDLLAKGFSVTRIDEIVKRMADLRQVDPNANMEGITRAIGQIAGTGRLQGDELNQLAENGLETGAVYDALAKNLGKTRAEVIKLKEAGKIDSDTAIQGILDAIAAQTGGRAAGAVAADARNSMSGIIQRFQNLPGNFMFSIGVREELDALRKTFSDVLSYFEGSGAERVMVALESTFGALIKGFTGVDVNAEGGLVNTIDRILVGVTEAQPQIERFAANVRRVFDFGGDIISAVGWFIEAQESVSGFVDSLGWIGTAAKIAFGPLYLATNGVFLLMDGVRALSSLDFSGWLRGIGEAIGGFIMSIYEGAKELGIQIPLGLVAGILSGAAGPVEVVASLARSAIDAAKSVLQIQSPSKAFEEIGMFTAMGFERGIAANDTGAIEALVAPPDLAAITGGAAAAGAGLAGGRGAISVEVNVDARGATAADADRIAELVSERVVRSLESAALSIGAAA